MEDLEGVEVIADDFLIAGLGSSDQEVHSSLERHETLFSRNAASETLS